MSIFNIQIFIYFTNLAAQNALKQRMTRCDPKKSLSNNASFVVKAPHLIHLQMIGTLGDAYGKSQPSSRGWGEATGDTLRHITSGRLASIRQNSHESRCAKLLRHINY